MASRPITYQAELDTPAPRGLAASIARTLAAFARAPRAYGIWHDIRVLEGQARKHADVAAQLSSLSVSNAAVLKLREAGDSVDFYVRHGRALHAQAVREMLRSLWRSLGRRRVTGRPAREVVWPATWFRGVAARCARAVAQELRLRRDMRHLMAMDDRMLKDIGLTRADVGAAVRYGRD